jgi:hypothetical protein
MTGGRDFETDSIDESDSSATSIVHGRGAAPGGVNPKLQRWSKFVRNLYEMTVSPENALAIGFSADGYCLEIRDPKLLSGEVLHRYFKHSNVSSFIRQLNNYGFRTIPTVMNRAVAHCFAHESFQRDRLDKLCNVRRRVPGSEAAQAAAPLTVPEESTPATISRDAEMEARLMQLTHMNDQLKRQNYELHEENKRLRASWRSSHEPHRSSSAAGMRAQHHPGQLFPDMHQQHHQIMRQQQSMHNNAQIQSTSAGVDASSSGNGGGHGYGASYTQKARPPYPGAPSYSMDAFGQPQGFFIDPNAAANDVFGMAGTPHLPPGPFWADE